jgi:hypothetical protein
MARATAKGDLLACPEPLDPVLYALGYGRKHKPGRGIRVAANQGGRRGLAELAKLSIVSASIVLKPPLELLATDRVMEIQSSIAMIAHEA